MTLQVDNYKIVSGSADTKIHIWDKEGGHLLRLLHGHAKSVCCLHIGPTWMVSGGADAEIRIWTLTDGDTPGTRFKQVWYQSSARESRWCHQL